VAETMANSASKFIYKQEAAEKRKTFEVSSGTENNTIRGKVQESVTNYWFHSR
jgi:hypothetical protein